MSNYATAYGRARYLDALLNSLLLGVSSATISMVLAVPMAWAVSRTDMPGKGLTWAVVLGAFVVPPYLGAVGWILLAGPNSGFVNQAWRAVTGAEGPLFNVYSFEGLSLVIALHSFPLAFIFVKAALDLVSSEMEDAANILGAGTWTAMRKVSLPLVWPAMLGAFIVIFLETIALFGTPAIIGIPARINVATTQLWQFFEYPVRVEVAAAVRHAAAADHRGHDRGAEAAARAEGLRVPDRQGRRAHGRSSSVPGAGRCSAGAPSWACSRWPCRCWCCCRPPSPRPGGAASASTT